MTEVRTDRSAGDPAEEVGIAAAMYGSSSSSAKPTADLDLIVRVGELTAGRDAPYDASGSSSEA